MRHAEVMVGQVRSLTIRFPPASQNIRYDLKLAVFSIQARLSPPPPGSAANFFLSSLIIKKSSEAPKFHFLFLSRKNGKKSKSGGDLRK